jgi:thiamine kinase-like enzyme
MKGRYFTKLHCQHLIICIIKSNEDIKFKTWQKVLAQMQKFEPAFAMKTSRIKKEAQERKKPQKEVEKRYDKRRGRQSSFFDFVIFSF